LISYHKSLPESTRLAYNSEFLRLMVSKHLLLILSVLSVYHVPMRTGTMTTPLHGGKDGTPYPVDRGVYDRSITMLKSAVERARIGDKDKLSSMKKLSRFVS